MDARLATKIETACALGWACSPPFGYGTSCPRCGGLLVGEFCMDLQNATGELEFLASRCVQCGDVVDPVILKNRKMQRPSWRVHPSGGNTNTNEVDSTVRT